MVYVIDESAQVLNEAKYNFFGNAIMQGKIDKLNRTINKAQELLNDKDDSTKNVAKIRKTLYELVAIVGNCFLVDAIFKGAESVKSTVKVANASVKAAKATNAAFKLGPKAGLAIAGAGAIALLKTVAPSIIKSMMARTVEWAAANGNQKDAISDGERIINKLNEVIKKCDDEDRKKVLIDMRDNIQKQIDKL